MKTKKIIFLLTFFLIGSFLCESCKKDEENKKVPTVTTKDANDITDSSAKVGGNVTDDGGETVIDRGVCFSTSSNPDIFDDLTIKSGSGTGSFDCSIIALNQVTMYYYKAYAINSVGVGYGVQKTFTTLEDGGVPCPGTPTVDWQGQTYNTVLIGTQCWMKENLNYATGNSWCYNNVPGYCDLYGRLYDWSTIMNGASSSNSEPSGVQGICPTAWHIPSDAELCTFTTYLDNTVDCNISGNLNWSGTDVGSKMKSTSGWINNGNGSNESGFNALPGMYRLVNGVFESPMGGSVYFWSSTEATGSSAWIRALNYGFDNISRNNILKDFGFALRCVKD